MVEQEIAGELGGRRRKQNHKLGKQLDDFMGTWRGRRRSEERRQEKVKTGQGRRDAPKDEETALQDDEA